MQNGKTIKTRKNVDFNVDIFNLKRFQKKLLTKSDRYVSINNCHGKQSFPRRKRFQKKLLTNESGYDKISELPLRTTATNERALAKQEVMIFDK